MHEAMAMAIAEEDTHESKQHAAFAVRWAQEAAHYAAKLNDQTITVRTVVPSTYVDTEGAVDAEIVAWGCHYGVTLAPSRASGELEAWGPSTDTWIHGQDMDLTREQLDDIVTAVRDAAGR